MPLRPSVLAALAGALIAAPPAALAGGEELPSGADAAFRQRMMEWRPQSTVAPVQTEPPAPPRKARAVLPRLSSQYGYRTDPLEGGVRLHAGIDIPGPAGSSVYAAAGGRIVYTGWRGGYGEMVEIDHGGGLTTRYAHLSLSLVSPGAEVAQGQRIALMGATGRATGSHLHFEVRRGGRPLDPLGFLTSDTRQILPAAAPLERSAPYISAFARAREAGDAQ
ncbi:M23 family metallopeptidase [Erythrobacter sp. SG61-1L]|uniref:M23 family metallopeptidase n=1 Tax=Erythrobacter sp. SG61-1L TaxID=1603897 RepID=UPI0006C8FA46|nr:M23 family metallopeptidase [Erythrobacter sp. SG61-1L]